jgi:hypothetical protein
VVDRPGVVFDVERVFDAVLRAWKVTAGNPPAQHGVRNTEKLVDPVAVRLQGAVSGG